MNNNITTRSAGKAKDISKEQEISFAVMNLIGLEEHLAFTAMKAKSQSKKREYTEMLNAVREMRKRLLKRIVKNKEGESWCASKHLLAASMRLMECGTKYMDKPKEAAQFFQDSFDCYCMFWLLQNMK